MKKRAKVHLLPTNDKRAVIGLAADEKTLWFAHNGVGNSYGNKHLYITTDDEIKEGDWYLDSQTNTIYKCDSYKESLSTDEFDEFEKIIATTDPELVVKAVDIREVQGQMMEGHYHKELPKPSKEFIEEYCRVGGIDEVDVEYELKPTLSEGDDYYIGGEVRKVISVWKGTNDSWYVTTPRNHSWSCPMQEQVKVTSNNEITIHPVKDSWTMEELPDLLSRFCKDHSLHRGLQITDGMIREWLEKQ